LHYLQEVFFTILWEEGCNLIYLFLGDGVVISVVLDRNLLKIFFFRNSLFSLLYKANFATLFVEIMEDNN